MNIAVSGMGRIGRLLIRRAFSEEMPNVNLKAVNMSHPVETIAHLLKYDTIHGKWDADIAAESDRLIINGHPVVVVGERDPERLPWRKLGIDIVVDATGKFKDRKGAGKHVTAGARKVIVTAPGKDLDATVVMGVNERLYDAGRHALISAASCTTNCVAPLLKILDDAFGVRRGWVTAVHAYTNDQNHLDNPHNDLRRARACGQSIVPTTTGVGKSLQDVIPHLAPVMRGLSLRVPTPDVSVADLTVQVGRRVTTEDVRQTFLAAANGPYARYVEFSELPLVSSDYIGSDKSAIVDGLSLMAEGDYVKVLGWYDNEWGYACRVVDLMRYVAEQERVKEVQRCEIAT